MSSKSGTNRSSYSLRSNDTPLSKSKSDTDFNAKKGKVLKKCIDVLKEASTTHVVTNSVIDRTSTATAPPAVKSLGTLSQKNSSSTQSSSTQPQIVTMDFATLYPEKYLGEKNGYSQSSLSTNTVPVFKTKVVTFDDNGEVLGNPFKSRLRTTKKGKSKPKPEDWKYKKDQERVTYFDERERKNGGNVAIPRVVTVVWSHDRESGVTRYGASVWTSSHKSDSFDKNEQRAYAKIRYDNTPIIVKMDPVPKTSFELQENIRWCIHKLGVSSKSKNYIVSHNPKRMTK